MNCGAPLEPEPPRGDFAGAGEMKRCSTGLAALDAAHAREARRDPRFRLAAVLTLRRYLRRQIAGASGE